MDDVVDALEQRVAGLVAADIGQRDGEVRIVLMLDKVRLASADQIVDHPHLEAAGEQQIHHVTADEAGPARDDRQRSSRRHCASIFFMVRTL